MASELIIHPSFRPVEAGLVICPDLGLEDRHQRRARHRTCTLRVVEAQETYMKAMLPPLKLLWRMTISSFRLLLCPYPPLYLHLIALTFFSD